MKKNIWLITYSSIVFLILVNNLVFFYITRNMLITNLNNELTILGDQIKNAAEQTRIGHELFEEQISKELRAASIAAKYALDPDVDKITAEQLVNLSRELGISHITLLKKLDDGDIVLYQSSDPSQINKSTATWEPWNRIFKELLDGRDIKEQWLGTALPHFWSGPYEVSSTDYKSIYKWGYFYDRTTNYIIDPYVDYTAVNHYNDAVGIDRLFENMLESNPSLLEIYIANPLTFPNDQVTVEADGNERKHNVQRPVLYGNYTYQSKNDEQMVKQVYVTGESEVSIERIQQANTYKMYIPVNAEHQKLAMVDENGQPMTGYVLVITADYDVITDQLEQSVLRVALITLLITAVMIPIIVVIMNIVKKSREEAVKVAQDTYIDEINALFQSIRSQRHDFINQVQTIHSLIKLKHYDELERYTQEIAGEIHMINDYINIGNPAIAALIRSKLSQAEAYHIDFTQDVKAVKLTTLAGQALNINRILGNLIDNAFDEVMKHEESKRKIHLYGREESHMLYLTISNYCEDAISRVQEPLFTTGYSTKSGEHQGLGLSIIQELVKQEKGEIRMLAVDQQMIQFELQIPLKAA